MFQSLLVATLLSIAAPLLGAAAYLIWYVL